MSDLKALVIVDVQHDFLPGGALEVANGDEVVAVLTEAAERPDVGLVVATRDWHPADHSSFAEQGGPWTAHCVQGSPGAALHPEIEALEPLLISTAEDPGIEEYSGFANPNLERELRAGGYQQLLVGGLALDYCVKATALDALAAGFDVELLADATRAVNVEPGDDLRALEEIETAGASITWGGAPVSPAEAVERAQLKTSTR